MATQYTKPLAAIVFVGLLSALCTFLIECFNFHNPLNAAWMVFVPLLLAVIVGKSWRSRAILGVALIASALASSMIFVRLFWGGI